MKLTRKVYEVFLFFILISFTLVMIGASQGMAGDKPVTLKLACQNLGLTETVFMTDKYFKKIVNERTGGKIQIKLYPDTIAKGPAAFSAAQERIADMVSIVSAFIGGRIKDVAPMDLLGAYPPERFTEVAKNIRPVMTKIFEQQDMKYLASFYTNSGLVFASSKRHYRTLEDLKGQKIRTPGLWWSKMLQNWGSSPMMILPPELYTSMQRGTVDSVATIMSLIVLFKLYEPGPYITEYVNQSVTINYLLMNMDRFNSLDKKSQDIIIQASKDAELYSVEYGVKLEAEQRNLMKSKAKYVMLSSEEISPILEKSKPIFQEMRAHCGPLGNELMDIFKSMK